MSAQAPFLHRTVVMHGPESTGKSVIAERLAKRFGSVWVPEYGREYCEIHGTDCTAQDLLNIAEGQDKAIDAAGQTTDGMIFSDTDALLTEVWSHMMLGHSCFKPNPPRISGALYLLTDIDTPFVDDGLRVYGADDARKAFFKLSEDSLKAYGVDYVCLSGGWSERETTAIAAVEARFGVRPS